MDIKFRMITDNPNIEIGRLVVETATGKEYDLYYESVTKSENEAFTEFLLSKISFVKGITMHDAKGMGPKLNKGYLSKLIVKSNTIDRWGEINAQFLDGHIDVHDGGNYKISTKHTQILMD